MERYDVETCMEVLLEHVDTRDEAADILDQLEPIMFSEEGCSCCDGDTPLFWMDDQNNAFIDSNGEISVMAKDRLVRFKVSYCPRCGRRFDKVE